MALRSARRSAGGDAADPGDLAHADVDLSSTRIAPRPRSRPSPAWTAPTPDGSTHAEDRHSCGGRGGRGNIRFPGKASWPAPTTPTAFWRETSWRWPSRAAG
jgi:hypothetical protein